MMGVGAGWCGAIPALPARLRPHPRPLLPALLLWLVLVLPAAADSAAPSVRFLQPRYNVSIFENSLPRTYVTGSELMGVDVSQLPLDAHVVFSIHDGDRDGFFMAESQVVGGVAVLHIRTRTGLRDVLNRERRPQYVLGVGARVRGHTLRVDIPPATTTVTVAVCDTNDNIPLFYPSLYDVLVGEDAAPHTHLTTVTAHDADAGHNGQVYYSLQDPTIDLFAVHPTTGVVSITRGLSQVSARAHNVVVLAQDRGLQPSNFRPKAAARATVEVTIARVNLHPPRIRVRHLPHVVEHAHTHIYAIINVDDKDEGPSGRVDTVQIISGDPARLFSIKRGSHDSEFNLAVLKLLDRELTPEGYNLTLQVTDAGTPPLHSRTNIHVTIADVNDNVPVFAKVQYEESVSEEAPPSTPVVRVAASDTDQGINGRVQFRIVAGNEDSKFSINPRTGLISTAKWLDHENTDYYSLTVAAIDQASNARRKQSSAKVIIRVLDANDNAPQFTTPNTEVTLDENEPISSYVTRVVASDPDTGENGFISYSIANLDQVPFTIDPFNGVIRTSSVLDYEAQRWVYTIKVRASDWGTPFKRETETTVKVKVRDVNDNRPQFEGVDCKGWVSINAPLGTNILTMSALDLDAGSMVSYKLQGDLENSCWSVDGASGVIALTCDLRRHVAQGSRTQTFVLNMTATDGTHVSDTTSVTVAVITPKEDQYKDRQYSHVECRDTGIGAKLSQIVAAAADNNAAEEHYALLPRRYGHNSHSPELPAKLPSVVEVLEDAEVGQEVITINATDHDQGYNGRVVYAISAGDSDSVFKIGIESGVLEVCSELDRETTPQYDLSITVYDLGVPHRSVTTNITVQIIDVNDNAPEFTRVSYSLHLPENTRNGTSVAQLSAQDADEGNNSKITYELVTDVKEFSVARDTGVVYVTGTLDRERQSEYDLRVRAWDNSLEAPRSALARVLVMVLDINDSPPEFGAAATLAVDVPEDLPAGAVVATLKATDQDLGVGGLISYSLVDGHGDMFRVDERTGVVRVTGPLDFETRQSYNITIKARDNGSPPLEAQAALLVRIHDVDENLGPPRFAKRVVEGWVRENLAPGALVVTVAAKDPDPGTLTYTITGGDGLGYFSVDREGTIRTRAALDREVDRGYWLTLVVADRGTHPLTDTCHVYIEVEDVNDHIPQTVVPSYQAWVGEDAAPGTHVVTLEALDLDLAPSNLTYAITGGNDLAHFQVDANTGEVVTAWTLDREVVMAYEVWISVSDGQLSSSTPVFITVSDTNDNAPAFLEPLYRVTLPSRPRTPRREPVFRPEAEEDGGESVWSWGDWVSFSPTEITNEDVAMFRVFARDDDTGMNADLNYSIKTGKGKGRFKMHPKTGQIYTNKALSPGHTYDLMVRAQDNGEPQMSGETRVLVRVARVPESSANPPVVSAPAPAHVMETDPPGHLLAFISAHDPDNDTLWYYLTGGDDRGLFSVGVDTGLVVLARRLDRENQYLYTLTVAVTDGVHTTTTKLVVEVLDANEHRPVFSMGVYEAVVGEGAAVGTSVVSLQCRDQDSPPASSSPVHFALVHAAALASHALFTLDALTGDLTVAKPLDREVAGQHVLTASCRDSGQRGNVDYTRIHVTVTDDNDHDPVFLENMFLAKVSTGMGPGTAVTRVLALDHDKGDNGRLTYTIVEGNAGGTFTIDPDLGVISLVRSVEGGGPDEYLLLVRATDHGTEPRAASVPVRVVVSSSPDDAPVWPAEHLAQIVEVGEWTPVGSAVARVTATAPSSLQYDITAGNAEGAFLISPASGVVSLAGPLDYETTAWYNLTVAATNMAGITRTTWLGVTVLDENDWWPEWDESVYEGVVVHTALAQAPVLTGPAHAPAPLTITATDRDEGLNGRVVYSIVERNMAQYFYIDQYTGAIRVSGSLEALAGKQARFSVWARDEGSPRRECVAPTSVLVTVRAVQTSSSAFSQDIYHGTLYLPTVRGVRLFCMDSSNPFDLQPDASPSPLNYTVIAGDDTRRFALDEQSLCLYVRDHLNLGPSYNLTLQATDGITTWTTGAEIVVRDAPLSTLKFSQAKYWANVYENSTKELNLVVVGLTGNHADTHVRYAILNPNPNFAILPTAGVVTTTGRPFDREVHDHYTLLVQAVEVEDDTNVAQVVVHVAVLDVNDNEPVFVNQPYHALAPTSAQRGHVVTKVRAVDLDAGEFSNVRYELVRGSGELFAVHKKTGEITLKQSLMVADKMYSLTVAAYDGGKPPLSSQAHVLIRVVSADGPVFTEARYQASVPENAASGTPVVRVEAASPSGVPLMYTIVAGDDDEHFTLDYTSGINLGETECVVGVAGGLDHEGVVVYNLTVAARDPVSGGRGDTIVAITVTDVNDNAPTFPNLVMTAHVSEAAHPGHPVIQVSATDVDSGSGGRVRYYCTLGCDSFRVSPDDGVVSVAAPLDAETSQRHVVVVTARDQGLPQRSSTASIIIQVDDFNDESPSWRRDRYECRVSPEAAPGHVLMALTATDRDVAAVTPLRYAIHGGDALAAFRLGPHSGVLTVTAPHRLTNATSVSLNVSASDGVHVAFTSVHVAITPANHHVPRLSRSTYEGRVDENAPGGQLVTTIGVEDLDHGVYGELTFSILDQMVEGAFAIDAEGNVYTEMPLDREEVSVHSMVVAVRDGGGRAAFATLRVSLRDENDNPPRFRLPEYQANINTDTAPGTAVLKVEALDPDEGGTGVSYSLLDANISHTLTLFKLNPQSGVVTLAAPALLRDNEVYQFFIRAEDGGSPPLHADVPVTVFLLGAEERPPRCPRHYSQFFLREDATPGTVITTLWTRGPMEVEYSIVAQDGDQDTGPPGPFEVTSGGLLVVASPLDHEAHPVHTIVITNATTTTPPALDYMTVSVVVMDVNDCAPTFSRESYEVEVAENSDVGAIITILTATDLDDGTNGQVQYRLAEDTSEEVRSTWVVEPHTGAVRLAAALDREAVATYRFSVVARDGGANPLSATATITVAVKDYNDNPPLFARDNYITAVPEDAAVGTAVLELSVVDADEVTQELDYFVTSGDPQDVFLVHSSGQVYVNGPLDRETRPEYVLTITATDGKFTANTTVTVTIIDVNDNGPECSVPEVRRSVSEAVARGTHVATVAATDADEGSAARPRYTLSGHHHQHFALDQQTGTLTTDTMMDREAVDLYTLTVVVEDWEHPEWSCQVSLEVSVTDANDNPPEFGDGPHSVAVAEDAAVNTVLIKMHATDPDLGINHRVQYSFVDSAEGHFTIDVAEGVVSLARPLDRETRDTYKLTVRAQDLGSPPLSSTVVLTVIVIDVNDNPPEFVRVLEEVTVAENCEVGLEVARFMATSRDIGVNAEITYSLEQNTHEHLLAIHPKTGVVSVVGPLDYEAVRGVVAVVVAMDGGTPPLSATALVNVSVVDVNDNAPTFTATTYTTALREDSPPGASVVQVSASDLDSGVNSLVQYSITGGNEHQCFHVDHDTGIITLLKELDREELEQYELVVGGRDLGTPSNTATVSLTITITDVNDNPPVFTSANYSVVVQENRPVGHSVLRLMATDADAAANGAPFTWELIDKGRTGQPFALAQDGTIRLATNKLNHQVMDTYKLEVRVWDSGSPPLHASTQVIVRVVEESRYPPTVFPFNTTITSYRNAFPGGVIGRVTALDQDPYDTLVYTIPPQLPVVTAVKYFDIDGQDGTLVALSPLDAGSYELNVSVSDGKFESSISVSVRVNMVTEEVIDSAIIVRIGPVSPEEFITNYERVFLQAVRSVLDIDIESLFVISFQPTVSHSHGGGTNSSQRSKRDIQRNLDILLVLKSSKDLARKQLVETLKPKEEDMRKILDIPLLIVMDSICTPDMVCNDHGYCVDVIEISDDVSLPITTQFASFVAPKFSQVAGCVCNQGYGGKQCQDLVNACGHRPCAEYEICTPSDTGPRGYTCQCPAGQAGPKCQVDLLKCQSPACHYPMRPMSFKGKSYAQYNIAHQAEASSLSLSLYLRTRHPVGTILYAAGDVDFSVLEVVGGHVQYRWDCGSGEGLVRVSALRVDDNQWHFINLSRDGSISTLSVDEDVSSGAAPGDNDILNIHSEFIFLGATIIREQGPGTSSYHSMLGFVGCLDEIMFDKFELPVSVTGVPSNGAVLKRLANVELQCPEILLPAGVCGSHPCLNGGTCSESGTSYKCTCPMRFTGAQCQVDTAPCSSLPCLNGGDCVVTGHSYKCKCPSNLSGKRCEYGVYCNPNPCQNGGRCEEGSDGPICKCQHFTGAMCQMDIDECNRSPCQNGGTCLNFYGGFKCICSQNVTGEYCTDALYQPPAPGTTLSITLKELLCILALFLVCIIIVLVIVAWQRRRWRHKRHQQNNRIKLTENHVKNDLKANDVPKRNSKICNVEADQAAQGPPLPPRPASYTPSGTDSVILNTLKHLADLSSADHESLELETLSRCSHELLQSLNKPTGAAPSMSPPPPALTDVDSLHKPWDHHNNLNDSYFMPIKDVGCALVANIDESCDSPSRVSAFSDDSSVPGSGSSPPAVPPLPRPSLLSRRSRTRPGYPSEVVAGDPASPTTPPDLACQDPLLAGGSPPVPGDATTRKPHRYQWDDYDMRGSRKLYGSDYSLCGSRKLFDDDYSLRGSGSLMGAGACATPDLLLLPRDLVTPTSPVPPEHQPLLGPDCVMNIAKPIEEETAATPLLSTDERDNDDQYPNNDDQDDDDDEPCSFEEILIANNITFGSTTELNHNLKYNIVSDLEEDLPEPPVKISNVPCPPQDNVNRLGSPRSRRPFHRADYSRVSDVSFLSALEEDDADDSLSELQDSDYDASDRYSGVPTATLFQTSASEVYL